MLWSVWAVTSRTSQGFFTFTHSCLPHPKTFQIRTIAALPEPAGRPTHGLLSRRSTDRISTSPLANFAQLSMFRFDGVKIQIKLYYRQQTKLYLMVRNTYVYVFEWKIFLFRRKKTGLSR
ncbi:hypothetical protein [Escherichia coli]|uniref:hypothetical protein n=1 Tax=Escherichia coli TaxID=562 RepID=UPI00345B6DEA